MSELGDRIRRARDRAVQGGIPTRRSDGKLYETLSECLSICEDVRTPHDLDDLRREISVSTAGAGISGAGRKYAAKKADVYVLVARAVLEGLDNRNSCYRYAATLREAARKGIQSQDLLEWLSANGGINALFRKRPLKSQSAITKTLHLNQRISVSKSDPVTIVVKRDAVGFFDVISVSCNGEVAHQ